MFRRAFKQFLRPLIWYSEVTERRPFLSISLSNGIILAFGDLCVQKLEQSGMMKNNKKMIKDKVEDQIVKQQNQEKKSIFSLSYWDWVDRKRFKITLFYGTFILGPLLTFWYVKLLPRLVPFAIMTPNFKQLSIKVLVDETLGSWMFYLVYLYAMTRLNSGTHQEAIQKLKKDFIRIYIADLKVWPLVQYINFFFIPVHLQSAMIAFVQIFWGAYLSYVNNS